MTQAPRTLAPGLAIALTVSLVSLAINKQVDVISPHVMSVAFGLLGANFGRISPAWQPGLRWSAKKVLRAGIVLLGFRLSLAEIGTLGAPALIAVIAVVVVTFFGTQLLARRLGLSAGFGLLLATGYSICGASAIAAVEPFAGADEEEVAYSIALVTLCGTLSIAMLPFLGSLMRLGPSTYGAWVGASVHDVGQVVAAASLHGSVALKYAVVVKLTRVAMLAPLLGFVALRRRSVPVPADAKRPPLVPLFLVLFLVAAAVRSSKVLDTTVLLRIKDVETVLLGMGLMALGSNVNLRRLRAVGGRPLVLGLLSWALIAVTSLVAVHLAGV